MKGEIDRNPRAKYWTMVTVEYGGIDVTNLDIFDVSNVIDKIAKSREYELTEAEVRTLIKHFDLEWAS